MYKQQWGGTENDRQKWRKNSVYFLSSTCSTILSQPSSMHIQLRYKVQPASVCLQLASIMDGFVCVYVCVCIGGMSRRRRRRRRCQCEWKQHSRKLFSPVSSFFFFYNHDCFNFSELFFYCALYLVLFSLQFFKKEDFHSSKGKSCYCISYILYYII